MQTQESGREVAQLREEFIEKIGLIAQSDGMPRIAGRLMGLLVWDGEAVSFADLAARLQVSRGSISTATRILEERRLIRRTAKPGQRQDFFQLAENPFVQMLEAVSYAVARAREDIEGTLAKIPAREQGIRDRVGAYSRFYKQMSEALERLSKDIS